jgi:hypothetical protein
MSYRLHCLTSRRFHCRAQVRMGYVIKGKIDIERFISSLHLTLAYFPLFGGLVTPPNASSESDRCSWSIELVDQPIDVEITHVVKSEGMLYDGVIQPIPSWRWSPELDHEAIQMGRRPHRLVRMGVTFLDDYGWTVLALSGSHVIGIYILCSLFVLALRHPYF